MFNIIQEFRLKPKLKDYSRLFILLIIFCLLGKNFKTVFCYIYIYCVIPVGITDLKGAISFRRFE